ncbi:glycine oxidase ThiO [Fictibacillus enclensis]|uniref:glycine oxidase ThiO n=1 Tax=Fictibacillus enclensis TaxID=1017270 RepID=UPI0025A14792|nr:glycine oxidase ThiO [Fictibacillus enclensis]MDM5336988.1 glycine oxidase ThiO [Fictibacillus enclensis]
MRKHYDVIIVGGGVIGSSIAYFLRRHTPYNVLVLERNKIGSEASSAAAGMLGAQAEIHEAGPLYEMARQSRQLFPELSYELKEISGVDMEWVDKGLFKTAKDSCEAERLQDLAAFHRANGQPAEWMDVDEFCKKEPNASAELAGALFLPKDGQVNAPKLTQAYAQAAVKLGADFMEYTEAAGFEFAQLGTGVQTSAGTFYGEKLVLASGVWTGRLAAQTGLHMPVFPVKGECLSLNFMEPVITSSIISKDCYLVPKQGGRLVIGATMRTGTYDRKVTAEAVGQLLDGAIKVVPGIRNGEWEKAWSGFRPQTPDGLPYMGKHPNHSNIYFAAGHFRNGILLSPITGQWITELVCGRKEEQSLNEFAPERFVLEQMKG